MFAYCENNAVMGNDPTGNWDTKDHARICEVFGFTPFVQEWVKYPDTYFMSAYDYVRSPYNKSTYCSAPFHSRDSAPKIVKYIYNKAIDVKKSKKKIKFYLSSDKTKMNKPGCLYISYFGYRLRDTPNSPLTIKNSKSKDLMKMLNSLNSSDKQSKALLGLALHTVQDYFAHKTVIYVAKNKQKLKKSSFGRYTTTEFSNNILKNTAIFEDNTKIFPWRFENTKKVTKEIHRFYSKKKKIRNIKIVEYGNRNKIYSYTLLGKKYHFKTVKFRIKIS